ncbi:MAG: dATP pyrophosphohydrolase, partial [Alteromonadaceae bacterium]
MAYKKPESVLVVLYDQHHKVLLLQRNDDPEFWQ